MQCERTILRSQGGLELVGCCLGNPATLVTMDSIN